MKHLAFLILIWSLDAHCAEPNDEANRVAHMGASAVASLACNAVMKRSICRDESGFACRVYCGVFAFGIGAVKEAMDPNPSWGDIRDDLIGVGIGSGISLMFEVDPPPKALPGTEPMVIK